MNLTITELAQAVDKSETFVRQHVHRKHLATQKDGRNVYVSLAEAVRWARERGLSFDLPARASLTTETIEVRTARMTVLLLNQPGTKCRNLFTSIRHRRLAALGPWASEPDGTWSSEDIEEGLRLFSIDTPLQHCQSLVENILESGKLEIDGFEIHYDLKSIPRRHRAYRNHRQLADAPMRSPFSRHSAEIIEYWSFAAEPRKQCLAVLETLMGKAPNQLARLGFALDRYPDRVGNLMVVGAEDTISCDLTAHHDRTLRLQVDTNELVPGAYRATVWATHSGDEVLRREISVTANQTVIDLASDVDHIGFAIYRATDGECIDLMEADLLKEIRGFMEVSGPTLHLHDRRGRPVYTVSPSGAISTINVDFNKDSDELDKGIRLQWLDRRVYAGEASARREGNFVRFGPHQFDQAAAHFIGLLRRNSDRSEPVYVADPYFLNDLTDRNKLPPYLEQLYLDMFAATTGRELRILCGQKADEAAQLWWSKLPNLLTTHVAVRTFLRRKPQAEEECDAQTSGSVAKKQVYKSGFHDRYLITSAREIVITNSFTGWHKHGVTFSSHTYGVYGAEAKKLWAMEIDSKGTDLFVQELA